MKEADPRVSEFTKEFFMRYEYKYKVKPMWGAKQGEHVKRMFAYCDMNRVGIEELYCCLDWYLVSEERFVTDNKHEPVYFCNNISKMILKYRENFKKPKVTAEETTKRMNETLVVHTRDPRVYIRETYTPEGFVKMMRFSRYLAGVERKEGKVYEHYKKWWLIGYEIFGEDTLKALWEPKVEKKDVSMLIEKALEIESLG